MTIRKPKAVLVSAAPPLAYSLVRFSTPQQAEGDSLRRQIDRTRKYCEAHNLTLIESIVDEGMSGYHGVHRKKGAFGRFVKRFQGGEIPPGGVFIAEGFDRITREPPRVAQALFLELINGGLDVVTLIDGQHYSAASLDANIGQLFMSIGLMLGAHAESKNKADRIRETWKKRRTDMTNNFPSWIVKTDTKPELDPAKKKVIKRIFKMVLEMGIGGICQKLNDEKEPIFDHRKRKRGVELWDKSQVRRLIRGRQVLGEQEVGQYTENRIWRPTGEIIHKAYPAAVTEADWHAANAALDKRKQGVGTGRNVTQYTNLFGPLARCGVCGEAMKIQLGGSTEKHRYLCCSAAKLNGCTNREWFRLDKYERIILKICGDLAYGDDPVPSDQPSLVDQIAQARAEAAEIERKHKRALDVFLNAETGSLEDKALKQLSAQHKAKLAEIAELERQHALARAKKPDTQKLQRLMDRLGGLTGEALIAARGRIARGLPEIIKEIRFTPRGAEITFKPGYKIGQYWERVRLCIRTDGSLVETLAGFGKPVTIEAVKGRLG
jgi:DNA invertase Pin-like site-specific DNA recombinase